MATYAQNLETVRNQIAARLVEVTAENKPTYSVDGKSVSWESYVAMLSNQLEKIEAALARASGPFEERIQART